MDRWLYVGLCIALPLVWGLAAALTTRWLESRRPDARDEASERLPGIDYYI
jgi:hypothetical protein